MYYVERLMALQMLNLTFLVHLCVQRQAQARLFHITERQKYKINHPPVLPLNYSFCFSSNGPLNGSQF